MFVDHVIAAATPGPIGVGGNNELHMVGNGRTIIGQIHDPVSVGMSTFARFGFKQGINRQVDFIADAVDDVEIVDRELVVHQRNRNRVARACDLAEQTRGPFQPIAQLRAIDPDRHKRVGIGAEVCNMADLQCAGLNVGVEFRAAAPTRLEGCGRRQDRQAPWI